MGRCTILAMTTLKLHILQILKAEGPLNDLELWCQVRDEYTGGLSAIVVIACIELQNLGYIEPPPFDPHVWQLSNKGMEYVAAQTQSQEVPLGSGSN